MITNMKQGWEERVQSLEALGADRSDAQSVVDAEDANEQPTAIESFAFANSMGRFDDLQSKCKIMVDKIKVKHIGFTDTEKAVNALAYLACINRGVVTK